MKYENKEKLIHRNKKTSLLDIATSQELLVRNGFCLHSPSLYLH